MNKLKQRLAKRRPTLGTWLQTGSPIAAEAAVYAGFKFALIDNEHGPASLETTAALLRSIEAAGGEPIVRVPAGDPVYLKRLLELGARSLLIPQVDSAEEAEQVVAACRYPPRGRRGYAAPVVRASRYGIDENYADRAHRDTCIMVQIESAAAVDQIDDIMSVDGVDLVFIGPNDLSGNISKLGQLDHPEVSALIKRVEKAANKRGMPLGNIPLPGADTKKLFKRGYTLVLGASDIIAMVQGLRAVAAPFKNGELG